MSLNVQFITILSMVGGGIYLGAAIETLRRFERYWKKRPIIYYMTEVIFWMLQALVLFYVLYLANQGELRFYIFLSVLCGFAAYQSLFKSVYQRLLELLIKWIGATYRFVNKVVCVLIVNPVKMLIKLIFQILIIIWGVAVSIFFILLKIFFYPIRLIGQIIWHLIPKNVRICLSKLRGFYSRIKNIIVKWWKRV